MSWCTIERLNERERVPRSLWEEGIKFRKKTRRVFVRFPLVGIKKKTSLVDLLHLYIRTHTHDSSSLFPSMKPKVKGIETEMNFSVYIYVAYKVEGLNLLWRGIASQPIFGDIYIAAGRDPRTWRFSLLSVPVTKFIRIGIADKNDNPPYFDKGLYEAEVDENEDIQHTVLTVTAKDHDECKWTHMQIREVFFLFSLSALTESCNRE